MKRVTKCGLNRSGKVHTEICHHHHWLAWIIPSAKFTLLEKCENILEKFLELYWNCLGRYEPCI